MTTERYRVVAGTLWAYILALASLRFSDVELDAFPLLLVLLATSTARIATAALPKKVGADAESSLTTANRTTGNSIRTGLLVIGFVTFLLFGQALRDLTEDVPPATLALAVFYVLTVLFLTARSQPASLVRLAIASAVIAIMFGANVWWLVPLAAAAAFAAASNRADRELPTIGSAKPSTTRSSTAKALAFAVGAALLAIWLRPNPPSGSGTGSTDVGEQPVTPPLPPTNSDWSWLLWLLLLLILVGVAFLLWWYLKRRRQPWPTRALRRFAKAGTRFGHPLGAHDTLPQFASRFPPTVGDLPSRVANALDSTTYSQANAESVESTSDAELRSLERMAKSHQRNERRNRVRRLFRRKGEPQLQDEH